MELFSENTPEVNASLILGLVELQAKEAAPLMERAFAAKSVDLYLMGEWDDVQVELGLLSPEEVAQRRSRQLPEVPLPFNAQGTSLPSISPKARREREANHKKAKSRMAKQSRKKNRKR